MAVTSDQPNPWATTRAFPGSPPDSSDRYRPIDTPAGRYWELSESGWDAMLGYLAGPNTLARHVETRQHQVEETVTTAAGVRTTYKPRTASDQAIIDEAANSYLRDVGLPTRPPGYRWFQRLPDDLTVENIDDVVHTALMASGLPLDHHPAEAVPVIRAALANLYAR